MNRTMQLLSLRDVASQINSGADLVSMLRQLVRVSCHHTGWTMGSIMSVDMDKGFAHVVARHDPTLLDRPVSDHWELASSPSVTALQRNEPVFIPDVRVSEYAGYKRESFERDYRTVLIIPMSCKDFDNRPMVLSLVSRPLKEVSEEDLAFLGLVVHLGAIALDRERQLEQQRRSAERLQHALQVHTSLLEHVLAEGSVSSLSILVGNLLPNPLIAIDFSANRVIAGRSPVPDDYDDATWQRATSGALGAQLSTTARQALGSSVRDEVSLFLNDGDRHFTLKARIEPLMVDRELVGALVMFASAAQLGELDRLLLESAKFALSVQMMRSFIRFRFETRTQSELFREVIEHRWRDPDDVQQRALRLSMSFNQAQRMIVVEFGCDTRKQPGHTGLQHNASRLLERAGIPTTVVSVDTGLVCLIANPDADAEARLPKLLKRMSDDLARYLDAEPVLLMSNTCHLLTDYPREWERCRRMIDIARSFGRTGPLSNKAFGPMPVLISAVGGSDIRSYVTDTLGDLIQHDREYDTPYLDTLSQFLRHNCRSQACADAMGVHVTTLRYRLGRIHELFDLNVDSPEQRFAVELAIQLHRVMDD